MSRKKLLSVLRTASKWIVRCHLSLLDLTLVPSHDKEMAPDRAAWGAFRAQVRESKREERPD